MELKEQKRMVAVLPANPYRCPKCGGALIEDDFPVAIFTESGGMYHDSETCFFCSKCGAKWHPYQIPEHPQYDATSEIFEEQQ
jgi:predicted RNA-binding Zn-ribbon protein involved in translation (DUF1610 family)